ncbi:MAG TPA: glycosyltransferase family 4 protein [Kiritimatiellia bacterium]|nr:glycosyltransferase family 4 protein [Kiritimatiellia bacterium]
MRFLVGADVPPDPDSGAAGTVVQCNHALRALGCEVQEIWSHHLGRRIQHGNLHYLIELPRTYRREVARRLAKESFDVVMLSQPHAYLAGEWLHRHHPRTLFLNRTHGWEGQFDSVMRKVDPSYGTGPVRQVMRALLARHEARVVRVADGVIAGCREIATYLHDMYGYPVERVGVFPHGIPACYLDPAACPSLPARWRRILYTGQFSAFKAPSLVAHVMNEILARKKDVVAGWVCDAKDHHAVRSLLDPTVRDRVTLYPWMNQEALRTIYDEHGVFLFPSYYEGFGKAPFEAMARGMAVVVTRVGGLADWIQDGVNGYVLEPGDGRGLVARVEALLDHHALAQRIGNAGQLTAQSMTWRSHAKGILEFARLRRAATMDQVREVS